MGFSWSATTGFFWEESWGAWIGNSQHQPHQPVNSPNRSTPTNSIVIYVREIDRKSLLTKTHFSETIPRNLQRKSLPTVSLKFKKEVLVGSSICSNVPSLLLPEKRIQRSCPHRSVLHGFFRCDRFLGRIFATHFPTRPAKTQAESLRKGQISRVLRDCGHGHKI